MLSVRESMSILGLPGSSRLTREAVKKAFNDLALKLHPDKGGNAEQFARVREAYEILEGVCQKVTCDENERAKRQKRTDERFAKSQEDSTRARERFAKFQEESTRARERFAKSQEESARVREESTRSMKAAMAMRSAESTARLNVFAVMMENSTAANDEGFFLVGETQQRRRQLRHEFQVKQLKITVPLKEDWSQAARLVVRFGGVDHEVCAALPELPAAPQDWPGDRIKVVSKRPTTHLWIEETKTIFSKLRTMPIETGLVIQNHREPNAIHRFRGHLDVVLRARQIAVHAAERSEHEARAELLAATSRGLRALLAMEDSSSVLGGLDRAVVEMEMKRQDAEVGIALKYAAMRRADEDLVRSYPKPLLCPKKASQLKAPEDDARPVRPTSDATSSGCEKYLALGCIEDMVALRNPLF